MTTQTTPLERPPKSFDEKMFWYLFPSLADKKFKRELNETTSLTKVLHEGAN